MTLRFNVLLACCVFVSTLVLTNAKKSKCASRFANPPDIKCGQKETKKYCARTRGQNAYSISSDGPIAAATSPNLITEVAYFQSLFHNISIDVVEKRERISLRPTCPVHEDIMDDGSNRRHEYETQRAWKCAALRHQKRIGLNKSKSTCFTHIKIGAEKWKDKFDHLLNFRDELGKVGRAMLKEAKSSSAIPNYFNSRVKCFDDVFTPIYRNIKTDDFLCTIMHSPAMRRDSKYLVNVVLTSEPLNYNLEEKNRLYIAEYWDAKTNKLRALNQSSYRYRLLSPVITNTTTALFTWGGAVKVSLFMNIAPVNGPAMQYILESTEKERDALGEGTFLLF